METQKTALYDYHKSLGAKFVPFAGYEMPVQYSSGIVDEHKITIFTCGIENNIKTFFNFSYN